MRFRLFVFIVFFHFHAAIGYSSQTNFAKDKKACLRLRVEGLNVGDSIYLFIYDHYFADWLPTRTIVKKMTDEGYVTFEFDKLLKPLYISSAREFTDIGFPKFLFKLFLLEGGDNYTINVRRASTPDGGGVSSFDLSINGKGALKNRCKIYLDSLISTCIYNTEKIFDQNGLILPDNFYDEKRHQGLKVLRRNRNELSEFIYDILSIDFFSGIEIQRLQQSRFDRLDDSLSGSLLKKYQSRIDSVESAFSEVVKSFSIHYPQFVLDKMSINRYKTSSARYFKSNANANYVLSELNALTNREVADRAITWLVFSLSKSEYQDQILDRALNFVKTDYCLKELISLRESNTQGQLAYNFILPDTEGNLVSLASFRGKLVFIDFWFTGCASCVKYYREYVSKAEEWYKTDSNIVFVSVNIDISKENWVKGIRENLYSSTSIINLNAGAKIGEHEVIKKYRVVSYPYPILVGRDGKIISNNRSDLGTGGADSLIRFINTAINGRNNILHKSGESY